MGNWQLTQEAFNLFLSWLDPDRDVAGKKYEDMRRRLVTMFNVRGCAHAEDLADETLDRFIRRLPAMVDSYSGDPIPYLYTIARHLHGEYGQKQLQQLPDGFTHPLRDAGEQDDHDERIQECLERCLGELEPGSRELVLDYYRRDKQAKIDFRKNLAERLGIASNALRIRLHRVRVGLQKCVTDGLEAEPPSETK